MIFSECVIQVTCDYEDTSNRRHDSRDYSQRFDSHTFEMCFLEAEQKGWQFERNRTVAKCPDCVQRGNTNFKPRMRYT